MLLPKFTIRQLLLGMVGVSVVCMVLAFAARGNVVAYGMGLAVLGVFVPLGVYAAVYWAVLSFSKILPGAQVPESVSGQKSHVMEIPQTPLHEAAEYLAAYSSQTTADVEPPEPQSN
jgi:hypothetical protein